MAKDPGSRLGPSLGPLLLSLASSLRVWTEPAPGLALYFLPVLEPHWRLRPEGPPGQLWEAPTLEVALCLLQEQIPVLLGRKAAGSAPAAATTTPT